MSERASAWMAVVAAAAVAFYVWARLLQAIFIWPLPVLWAALFALWTVAAPAGLWFIVRRVRARPSATRRW